MDLVSPIDHVKRMAAFSERLNHDKLIFEHRHVEVAFELCRSRLRVHDLKRLLHAELCMGSMVFPWNAADDDVRTGLQVKGSF